MTTSSHVDKCLTFIRTQLETPPSRLPAGRQRTEKLSITISRQTGTGGLAIANLLARYLDKVGPCPQKAWTVFDKNLVEEVLKQHNLPKDMAAYLSEERTSELQDMVEEMLGLHPSSWEMVRRVTETILNLAELGNVILVGRGANVITARLSHAFHIRIVGSLERRVERLQEFEKVSEKAARRIIEESDQARQRYVKKHFRRDLDEVVLYDLVLNTDRISDDDAARLIGEAALTRCR